MSSADDLIWHLQNDPLVRRYFAKAETAEFLSDTNIAPWKIIATQRVYAIGMILGTDGTFLIPGSLESAREGIATDLVTATPFLWEPDMVGKSLADTILSNKKSPILYRSLMPLPNMFWYLHNTQIPLKEVFENGEEGRKFRIGFVHLREQYTDNGEPWGIAVGLYDPGQIGTNGKFSAMMSAGFLGYGHSTDIPPYDLPGNQKSQHNPLYLVVRMLEFLKTHAEVRTERLSHADRKYNFRDHRSTVKQKLRPEICVITLRTPEPQPVTVEQEARNIEWSHRWVVRGHSRNQYYPSTGEHRTIWIESYEKGPEDKPFHTPLYHVKQ